MNNRTYSNGILFRHTGFTLIEVLIAVAIFSLVMVSLYSSFSLSYRAVTEVDDSLLKLQESRGILDIIKREIESAFYEQNKDYVFFKLDDRDFYGRQASEISFTSFSPLMPGIAIISYAFDELDEKMALRKQLSSLYTSPKDSAGVILLEDIELFVIEAKYKDQWVKTWDSNATGRLPDELRISIAMKIGDRKDIVTVSDIARPKIGKTL
ncbi:MAG: prepilin-type N-terminal cleavage/methylation domain-containing protein [Nitrospiraceae bacterium]|nr:MAG: prepilin-type N-terminal cleavage/methylation domain-containing protein [Nitrospiraceae bacterium]